MPSARFVALFVAVLGLARAGPPLLDIPLPTSPTRHNGYIVSLKDGAAARGNFSGILDALTSGYSDALVRYEWPVLGAFAGTFGDIALLALRASNEVAQIEHDTFGKVDTLATQMDAPWGLQRVSQVAAMSRKDSNALNYTYTYDNTAGNGVDIYVVDTGVMIDHKDFNGRARWGKTFGGYEDRDVLGHGTHVAGSAAGSRYGVAKAASIVAVRVMNDDGGGYVSDAIAGVNWAVKQVTSVTRRPSIITMSLKYDPSNALDSAVKAAIKAGIHVTVSAGNDHEDASAQSPARAQGAICVGATSMNDTIASFSNYGPRVDVFAPGVDIISAYNTGNASYATMSGTSMSTPHVAGLVAYLISLEGNKSPKEVLTRVKELGTSSVRGAGSKTTKVLINNGLRT